ncbi:MAG: hypothetical protein HQK50_05215 [Oligoflexia bacterium]|nr:hypothetical protein [Oligoflexia bacterium]
MRIYLFSNWCLELLLPSIRAGVYTGAKVIDLAPTIAFLLGNLPLAMNEGRVLSEILKRD